MNLFDIYNNRTTQYNMYDKSYDELDEYILDMQHKQTHNSSGSEVDEWVGVRLAGEFFAYGRPCVWVYMKQDPDTLYYLQGKKRKQGDVKKRIWREKGFSLLISTLDDSSLFMQWDVLSKEQVAEILYYFNTTLALEKNTDIASYLSDVVGPPQIVDYN